MLMKKFLNKTTVVGISLTIGVALSACGGGASTEKTNSTSNVATDTTDNASNTTNTTEQITTPVVDVNAAKADGLVYLNSLRQSVGLIPFINNIKLAAAAQAHSAYIVDNDSQTAHEEQTSGIGFTGVLPSDRAFSQGYLSSGVGENIAFNKMSVKELVDDLMSAIYHRMGLLNFDHDELGVGLVIDTVKFDTVVSQAQAGKQWAALTTLSGNTYYNALCEVQTPGAACSSINIATGDTSPSAKVIAKNTKDLVVWPTSNSTVPPAFYEEHPDPLPTCTVSGYPVTVQLPPDKVGVWTVSSSTFSLKNAQDQNVALISSFTNLDDPNRTLRQDASTHVEWLAFFPEKPLGWGKTYTATITYSEGLVQYPRTWQFKTYDAPYRVVEVDSLTQNGAGAFETTMQKGEAVYINITPSTCNDWMSQFSFVYPDAAVFEYQHVSQDNMQFSAQTPGTYELTIKSYDAAVADRKLVITVSE